MVDRESEDIYKVRLRALQWTSSLLEQLAHSTDRDAVAIAAHWALNAVYDLSEAYWPLMAASVVKSARVDHLAETRGGEQVSALMVARGKVSHELELVTAPSHFRDLPYDFADLTDWVWADPTWEADTNLQRQTDWFARHISGRPLWNAIDSARYWFTDHGPTIRTGESLTGRADWVDNIVVTFHTPEEQRLAAQLVKEIRS